MEDPYFIIGTRVTEPYLKGAAIAKMTLDQNFERFNEGDLRTDFYWLRYKIAFPNFDDMAFCYRNQVFSVLLVADKIKDVNPKRLERFLSNCKRYSLFPCFFIVDPESLHLGFTPWGLCDIHYKRLRPELMATSAKIPMSEYEMYAYMITLVTDELEKANYKINSLNYWPGADPQIWFYDHKGRLCWLLVRRTTIARDKDSYKEYFRYERFFPQFTMYDGFYASVFMMPKPYLHNPDNIIYRENDFVLYYEGMHRIFIYDYD